MAAPQVHLNEVPNPSPRQVTQANAMGITMEAYSLASISFPWHLAVFKLSLGKVKSKQIYRATF